jgi:hypothetical protein
VKLHVGHFAVGVNVVVFDVPPAAFVPPDEVEPPAAFVPPDESDPPAAFVPPDDSEPPVEAVLTKWVAPPEVAALVLVETKKAPPCAKVVVPPAATTSVVPPCAAKVPPVAVLVFVGDSSQASKEERSIPNVRGERKEKAGIGVFRNANKEPSNSISVIPFSSKLVRSC